MTTNGLINPTIQISSHLESKGLIPTKEWLDNFLSTQKSTTAIAALKQTALFRLLASDLTICSRVTAASTFPADILNAETRERRLPDQIVVQVLDVEDIGRSRWSQIEAIEADERGEMTKGREVISVISDENSLHESSTLISHGPHKLLLQDARGTLVYGIEVRRVDGIDLNMNIGTKFLLKNVTAARGTVLIDPDCITLLGGKIDALHKSWRENRKSRLQASLLARD